MVKRADDLQSLELALGLALLLHEPGYVQLFRQTLGVTGSGVK